MLEGWVLWCHVSRLSYTVLNWLCLNCEGPPITYICQHLRLPIVLTYWTASAVVAAGWANTSWGPRISLGHRLLHPWQLFSELLLKRKEVGGGGEWCETAHMGINSHKQYYVDKSVLSRTATDLEQKPWKRKRGQGKFEQIIFYHLILKRTCITVWFDAFCVDFCLYISEKFVSWA